MENKMTVRELNEMRKSQLTEEQRNNQISSITMHTYDEYAEKANKYDSDLDDLVGQPTEDEISDWKKRSGR